jgi:virulence-associated protein VapD
LSKNSDYKSNGYFDFITSKLKSNQTTKQSNVIPKLKECNNILTSYYIPNQSHDTIKDLQTCLRQNGFYNYYGGVTGYFGDYTLNSYKNWLNSSNSICQLLKYQNYNVNETSLRIKRLQQCLNKSGLNSDLSSMFDTKTMLLYKTWQTQNE